MTQSQRWRAGTRKRRHQAASSLRRFPQPRSRTTVSEALDTRMHAAPTGVWQRLAKAGRRREH